VHIEVFLVLKTLRHVFSLHCLFKPRWSVEEPDTSPNPCCSTEQQTEVLGEEEAESNALPVLDLATVQSVAKAVFVTIPLFSQVFILGRLPSLDLEHPPKAHALKAWYPAHAAIGSW
jgi:hypothetical protein